MTSPHDPHSRMFSHINGPIDDLIDRLAVAELCKGWPVYRDASEWKNFRSLFSPNATVWTTWTGPCKIDDFITMSKDGKASGDFIMHRECGTLVELGGFTVLSSEMAESGAVMSWTLPSIDDNRSSFQHLYRRAVGKMKATITQRFTQAADEATGAEACEFDVDCDCRFVMFCERKPAVSAGSAGDAGVPAAAHPQWQIVYVKLVYEKDKIVAVDGGRSTPLLTPDERRFMANQLPLGYRYLGLMQHRLGYRVDPTLATPKNDGWEHMYAAMEAWLAGNEVVL